MKKAILILFFCIGLGFSAARSEEQASQTISEFNLTGFGEKGKKSWEISGKSADIFTESVQLKDIVGKLYRESEDITLTAKRGNFDKLKGNVHLEDDVVITTAKGARLTTNTLDWDRNNQIISTGDQVNIQRDNLILVAQGARGEPDFKKVNLQKEVRVEINPDLAKQSGSGLKQKIIITCDGPLEVDYEKNIATFYNNVKVDQEDNQIYSDHMEVYFTKSDKQATEPKEAGNLMGSQIDKIVAKGNVKIVRGDNISYSEEAVYNALEKKIILTGKPQLIIYSTEDLSATTRN